jgi:hypothetical protein
VTALRSYEAATAACLRQATANFERRIRAFEIHVFPLEGQELALPQAGGDGQYIESLHTVAFDSFEERPHLIPGEGPHLLSAGLRRLYGRGGVAWDQTVVSSLFERFAERAMDVQHASGSEPGIQLLPVEGAHVIGREGLEPDPAQRRAQMHPDDALISLVGLLAHGISNRVREPAGQILTNSHGPGVERQSALTIRESPRELRRDLLAGLAV